MLKAWNTGHPGGVTTVHANCAVSALLRLEQLIQEAVVTVPRDLIVQAIDVIVFLSGRGNERRVETVAELADLDLHGNYVLKPLAPPVLHAIPGHTESCSCGVITAAASTPSSSSLVAACADVVATGTAHAAGSGMPWEAPLQRILESVEGPVAKIIAVIIIIVTGLSLSFGDMGGGFRRLLQIVFGLSIAFAATSFFLSFFSFAGGALID